MYNVQAVVPCVKLNFCLRLLRSQLYLWGSPSSSSVLPATCMGSPFFVFFCIRSNISGVYHSSSSYALPTISPGFTILLLLLCSQLYLWRSPFFFVSLGFTILLLLCSQLCSSRVHHSSVFSFFCCPTCISRVYHFSSSVLPAPSLILRGSPFFSFFCVPSYSSCVHHSSIFSFFCIPRYISWVYHSSSSAFLAISLGFTILLLLSQLQLLGSPFFFCVPSYIPGVHHSYSSSVFPAISLGFTILLLFLRSQPISGFTILFLLLCFQLYLRGSPFWVRFLRM